MRCNYEGMDIIRHYEGFYETSYLCPSGIPTIGFGSCFYSDGTRVAMGDKPISREEASELLVYGLRSAENAVARMVRTSLTINQFSSLVSLVYNIGSGRFMSSTIRSKLNRQDYTGARNEFWKWRRSNGRIMRGLVLRRADEAKLFSR